MGEALIVRRGGGGKVEPITNAIEKKYISKEDRIEPNTFVQKVELDPSVAQIGSISTTLRYSQNHITIKISETVFVSSYVDDSENYLYLRVKSDGVLTDGAVLNLGSILGGLAYSPLIPIDETSFWAIGSTNAYKIRINVSEKTLTIESTVSYENVAPDSARCALFKIGESKYLLCSSNNDDSGGTNAAILNVTSDTVSIVVPMVQLSVVGNSYRFSRNLDYDYKNGLLVIVHEYSYRKNSSTRYSNYLTCASVSDTEIQLLFSLSITNCGNRGQKVHILNSGNILWAICSSPSCYKITISNNECTIGDAVLIENYSVINTITDYKDSAMLFALNNSSKNLAIQMEETETGFEIIDSFQFLNYSEYYDGLVAKFEDENGSQFYILELYNNVIDPTSSISLLITDWRIGVAVTKSSTTIDGITKDAITADKMGTVYILNN